MENKTPLVSVYVPCFNVEKYIEKCVESILNQTYTNIDVVLIDNNSTDGTAAILEKLKNSDSRIRLFSEEGRGIARVRNAAIGYCLGEWIVEVDSDDALVPNGVEALLNLALTGECSMACCSYYLCSADNFSDRKTVALPAFASKNKEDIHKYFLTAGRNFNQTWGKIYRRDILENIKYPDGKLYEDLAVMPDIIENCDGCVVSSEPIYYYVLRPGSITSGSSVLMQTDGLDLRLKNCEFYEKNYPSLRPLSCDCVLEFAFFLLGLISKVGADECKESFEKTLKTIKAVAPKAAKAGLSMKVGVLLAEISPALAGKLFAFYSELKNKTK